MKQTALIFILIGMAILGHSQKRIDYVKQTSCESLNGNKAAGEIYFVNYNADKGYLYHYKMDEFQQNKLKSSEFNWSAQDESRGISYSINHEENEELFSMNWYCQDSISSIYYSFSLEVFNGELEIDSRARIECDIEGSEFEREFEITSSFIVQVEKFVEGHLRDSTPFTFQFPIFDLSVLNQPIYSWHSESKKIENNISIQYDTDSTLLEGQYEILTDSSYKWDIVKDEKTIHHYQHGQLLQSWEGSFHAKSSYARITLTPDYKDTTYKIEYSRNKHNEKPYHNIEVTHYLTEHTVSIDIEKRFIHIDYDKIGIPIYREMKAITFDGQEVYSVWGKKLKEEENLKQLYVIDSVGGSHYVEIYPSNIQLATHVVPLTRKKYRPNKMNRRKRERRSLKRIKSEFKLVEKSKDSKTFISDEGGSFIITEVFYK